jgi:hypothetical protein
MSPAASALRTVIPTKVDASAIQPRGAIVKLSAIVQVQDHRPALAAPTSPGTITNPLWLIVIALACFFGATGLIIAFS